MKRSILLHTTLMLAFILSAGSAFGASFADTYGMSPIGIAMGNAMAAHVNDWSAVYYNPAGLGRTAHIRLAKEKPAPVQLFAGYLYTSPQTDLDIPARSDENGTYSTNADNDLDYGAIALGLTADLNMFYDMESIPPYLLSSCRFGLGLGINDDLSVAKVSDLDSRTHNYLRYGREAQQLNLIAGLGLGFLDDLFGVGVGMRSSFGGEGRVLVQGVEVNTGEQIPTQQTYLDMKLETSFIIGLYADLGDVDLGFVWRDETKMKIDPFQTATVTAAGDIPMQLALSIMDYYQPTSYTLGVSYQVNDRLMVAFDLEYQKWSDYTSTANQQYIYSTEFDNPVVYLGLPELDDIWIPKIGLQYALSQKTELYCGYYYQPSFVPDSAVSGLVNWLDNDKHVASIGVSYNAGKFLGFKVPVSLHAGYQLQYLVDREVTKSSPTSLNPSYSYGGTVHTIMVGFSL